MMISIVKSHKILSKKRIGYLAYVVSKSNFMSTSSVGKMLVVCEFVDIFLDNLLKLALKIEIELKIEFALKITPILKAPYLMALMELQKLKK